MAVIGIVAVDNNWGIGKAGRLLFNIKEDMAFFKNATSGHKVIMGRHTLLSLPGGRPLKNRENIVLCSANYSFNGCTCVHSLNELITYVTACEEDVYIIGGGQLYKAMLPYYDRVLVTRVDASTDADTFFPNLDIDKRFTAVSSSGIIETDTYGINFVTYIRNR